MGHCRTFLYVCKLRLQRALFHHLVHSITKMSFSLVNSAIRGVARALPTYTRASLGLASKPVARSLWYMSHSTNSFINNHNRNGTCPCGTCGFHTKGDKELIEFLSEEIASEKSARRKLHPSAPSNLEGFDVSTRGSELKLSKKFNEETVELTMNLNHSVDTDVSEDDLNPKADNAPDAEMKSKPQFDVKLIKGSKTVQLACSCVREVGPDDDGATDLFTIDELSVYEGTADEQTYVVAGDIIDGYMYDLLMNLLEERGVSNDFIEKMIELTTNKEHEMYVSLLERLQTFVEGK